jgi:penicillin-binding protein 1A
VWVGYDNATSRRTLGSGQTGGHVAVPIFEPIMKAAWTHVARQVALAPPSPEARRQLVSVPIDLASGSRIAGGERGERIINEYFRLDGSGRLAETQYRLVGPEEAESFRYGDYSSDGQEGWSRGYSFFGNAPGGQSPTYYREYREPQPTYREPQPNYREQQQNQFRNLFGGWMNEESDRRERQRRYDPDYFWNNNRMN